MATLRESRLIRLYHLLPVKLRIVGTGLIGLLLSLVTYEIIYALNPIEPRASISWCLAFMVGIARQHALHRWLTFTHYSPYWPSLGRSYAVDIGAAVLGTGLNWFLTETWQINHHIAWAICLLTTAVLGIVLLERFVFRANVPPLSGSDKNQGPYSDPGGNPGGDDP